MAKWVSESVQVGSAETTIDAARSRVVSANPPTQRPQLPAQESQSFQYISIHWNSKNWVARGQNGAISKAFDRLRLLKYDLNYTLGSMNFICLFIDSTSATGSKDSSGYEKIASLRSPRTSAHSVAFCGILWHSVSYILQRTLASNPAKPFPHLQVPNSAWLTARPLAKIFEAASRWTPQQHGHKLCSHRRTTSIWFNLHHTLSIIVIHLNKALLKNPACSQRQSELVKWQSNARHSMSFNSWREHFWHRLHSLSADHLWSGTCWALRPATA